MVRRSLAALLAPLLAAGTLVAPPAGAAPQDPIQHVSWGSGDELAAGSVRGVAVKRGKLLLTAEAGRRTFEGRRYDKGTWTSPWVSPGFGLTELIPSWQASTPGDSWIEVRVRGRERDGSMTSWDTMARWTSGGAIDRTTLSGQDDDGTSVAVDTWRTPGVTGWQLKVLLMRREGTSARLRVDRIGAVASAVPARSDVATSATGPAAGKVLDVPAYSQMIHSGHSPQWGGGGQAWCSPTSTSMVLAYRGALPGAAAYGWVPGGHPDPWVDHAARMVYDHGYDGAGNWAFNTAYAGGLVKSAYVTRLHDLREAEDYIVAGTPLVASIAFGRGDLTGAPISSSGGHLLVIVGFEADGDVVVNDPAAPSNASVRRVYDRGELEDAWQTASSGTVYVIG
ncbi:hypothetical protein DDE18_03005 [Nocardioides gansuensis]|uniref:Peptidase C39-like domain-containing protein n=1 Tax=Nocardioides gansuensis TaxID=2138300 RepID=A0A2T8FFV9_9ACTN|nr:C39 family peptidase [Nocardioides gansuensis]PVG84585.1 hypothetical protein DDE18_03005 [Nocardioides gansuensis]